MEYNLWGEQCKIVIGMITSWSGSLATMVLSIEAANQVMTLLVGLSTFVLTWMWVFYVRAKREHLEEQRDRERAEYDDDDEEE